MTSEHTAGLLGLGEPRGRAAAGGWATARKALSGEKGAEAVPRAGRREPR